MLTFFAERFDSETGDVFALQNEITGRIAYTLGVELIRNEAARPTSRPDALDYIFRARAVQTRLPTWETRAEATRLFEHALALDPPSSDLKSRLANILIARSLDRMTNTRDDDLARAEKLIDQAAAVPDTREFVLFAKGQLLRARGRYVEAIAECEKYLAIYPSSSTTTAFIARCLMRIGSVEEAIAMVERAIRLSPALLISPYCLVIWARRICCSRAPARLWFEKARSANPAYPWTRLRLAAAYALNGETELAAAEVTEARRLGGASFAPSIATMRMGLTPKALVLYEATYFAGLRKAGVPEE